MRTLRICSYFIRVAEYFYMSWWTVPSEGRMDGETLGELRLLLDMLPADDHAHDEAVFLLDLLEHPEKRSAKEAIVRKLTETYDDEKLALILNASSSQHAIEIALMTRLRELLAHVKKAASQSSRTMRSDLEENQDSLITHAVQREAQRAERKLPREVLLHELHPIEALWLADGRQLRTIPDLIDFLQHEQIPTHEWPRFKKQIIRWLTEAFQAEDLAARIDRARTREDVLRILQEELTNLIEQVLERTRHRYERLKDLHAYIQEAEEAARKRSSLQHEQATRHEADQPQSSSLMPRITRPPASTQPHPPQASSSHARPHTRSPSMISESSPRLVSSESAYEHTTSRTLPEEHSMAETSSRRIHVELPLDHPIPGVTEEEETPSHADQHARTEKTHGLSYEDPFADTLTLPHLPAELKRLTRDASRIVIDEAAVERVLRRHHESPQEGAGKIMSSQTQISSSFQSSTPASIHPHERNTPPMKSTALSDPENALHTMRTSMSSSEAEGIPAASSPISHATAFPDASFYKQLLEQLARREEELQRLEREVEEKLYELLHAEARQQTRLSSSTPSASTLPPTASRGMSDHTLRSSDTPPPEAQSALPIQHADTRQDTPKDAMEERHHVHTPAHTHTPHTPAQRQTRTDTGLPRRPLETPTRMPLQEQVHEEDALDEVLLPIERTIHSLPTTGSRLQTLDSLIGKTMLPQDVKKDLDMTFQALATAVSQQNFKRAVRLIRQAKRLLKRVVREEKDARLRFFLYELETLEIDVRLNMLGESA